MKTGLILCVFIAVFSACTYVPGSDNKLKWFAVLENGGPEKLIPVSKKSGEICLQISATSWYPLVGPDGFGGPREGYMYWTNLSGEGPVYRDPEFNESDRLHQSNYRGTIAIDKKHNRVVIDLQRIVSKPGEPEKLEPSPANGTYPIKRWVQ